jgi:lysophospholipid acyltransferase (LPLAT)-like uncharacterized protein
MLKRMLRSETGSAVVSWALAKFIWLTARSIRWQMATPAFHAKATKLNQPIIAVFWHSRIIQMGAGWRESKPIAMLQSPHPDGKLIARAIQRGGMSVGITPDGPRGPRMRLSVGVVAMARLSGAPVMPVAWNVKHRKVLRTWDRMLLARPFSRGVVFWGEPIYVPKTLTPEEFEGYRLMIETRLTEITDQADLHFGHQPTTPAEPAEEPGKRDR